MLRSGPTSGSRKRCSRPSTRHARPTAPRAASVKHASRSARRRGVRLHLPDLDQEAGDRASRAARLRSRPRERRAPRPAGDRQDAPVDRLGHPRVPGRGKSDLPQRHQWVALLTEAQRNGDLEQELRSLDRYPLLVCDEIGYIPFDPQAANLMFMLISRRYEKASLIVSSNKNFSLGRDLRRRHRRHRDDRPPRPPRRNHQPQGRELSPEEPRPRHQAPASEPRHSLTNHPRAPSPRAAKAPTEALSRRPAAETTPARPRAPPAARSARRYAGRASPLQPLLCRHDPHGLEASDLKLELLVKGYEFPQFDTGPDGNALLAKIELDLTASIEPGSFHSSQNAILYTNELQGFTDQLRALAHEQTGQATLGSEEPGETLSLTITQRSRQGHHPGLPGHDRRHQAAHLPGHRHRPRVRPRHAHGPAGDHRRLPRSRRPPRRLTDNAAGEGPPQRSRRE